MTPVLLVNKRPPPSESMFMVHYSFFFVARKQDASIKKMELTREIVASSYIIIT